MARIGMVVFGNYSSDQRVRREAEALVSRGDEVDCICLYQDPDKKRIVKGVRLFYPPARKYRGERIVSYLIEYFAFFLYAFVRLSTLHVKRRYDVVQVHTMPDFLVFAALIPKLLGAKIILDVHDLMPELYAAKFGVPKENWLIRLITWVERRSVAFADRTMAVHEPHLAILAGHGNPKEKFLVLLNLPDSAVFARADRIPKKSNDNTFIVVYHGVIVERSGIDVALRAVALARKEIPGLKFRIIGADEGLPCTELVDQLRRDGSLEIFRTVPTEGLPALLADADAGIVPYVKNEFTRCVLPVRLMEYVALGIPVITSRLETIEAHFDDDMVRYFTPGNEVELAQQIIALYCNPQERKRLVMSADRFLREHNWETAKKSYFGLVDSLLAAKGLGRLHRERGGELHEPFD